jgi:hypothetical protein
MGRQIHILILSSFKDREEAQLLFDHILADKEDYRLSINAIPQMLQRIHEENQQNTET